MKKGAIFTACGILIFIGLIGIILPLIPGIPFLILGFSLLGIDLLQHIKKYI